MKQSERKRKCGADVESNVEGIIFKIEKSSNRILVVQGLNVENMHMSIDDLLHKAAQYPEAYWISGVDCEKYKLGDIVKVWFEQVEESYPAQAVATLYELVERTRMWET
ncbi:DUF3221 domain-containing protein [Paenibacillus sp. 481]|uniref:DUF3221 domain-containing protein n=1 Tax=Paenibacillus sp. 481 TaxID=2835869 RepID=UPI001E31C4A3|nr:DUF3221 domain-containing protein [Paenibacillus sp. 481]UHA73699.1 DUF3221 domain-containing protein [Paenibacillus sp. 481]